MVYLGRELRYWTYYILAMDFRLFRNLSVRYPRKNSDHYMILGCLRSTALREPTKYLGRHTRISIRLLTTLTIEVGIFAALWRSIPNPKAQEARENAWILADTWRLVDTRVSVLQDSVQDQ